MFVIRSIKHNDLPRLVLPIDASLCLKTDLSAHVRQAHPFPVVGSSEL